MKLNGTGFKNGIITLDEANAVYYPAQTISGQIEFKLREPLSFSAINVVYRGEASVSWTEVQKEKYSGVKRYVNVEYKGNEEYFNFTQCVYGGNGPSFLNSGTHSIPFSYQIPYTAPSSFESAFGKVSYKITAYLECPPVMREELTRTFEIVAPLDLNKDTTGDIKRPINMEFEEVYSCCCSSQPITIGVKLPVSGYCPGQPIPITIDVNNESSMEISKMKFQLVTKERYHSRYPVSENIPPEKVLATKKKGPVMGKTRRQYQCDLKVPDMLAPNLENCSIINIGYFFKVTVKLPGCMDDIQDESEVYIGLIPLEITTGGSMYIHPLKHRLPGGLPPPGLPLPYGSNSGINLPNLITHIPLRSPQMNESHGFQHTIPVYPYPVQQIVPSAPIDTSPVNYSGQSPISSPHPAYPYPVHHQTLVTASIEQTSPHTNSYSVHNRSPEIAPVHASPHTVNYPLKTPIIVVKSPSPYPNQGESPELTQDQSPHTTPMQITSPHSINRYPVQIQSPITSPTKTTSPHPNSIPVQTIIPQTASNEIVSPHLNSYPVKNHSPGTDPIETTNIELSSPRILNQSPVTLSRNSTSPHQVNSIQVQNPIPVIHQSPQKTPKETTSPRTAPIVTTSPRMAAIETTNSQTGPIETTSSQTGPIEATSPRMVAIETISPRMAPIETNSPRKAAIETTNSQMGPIETTSPQTGPIEATSPRMVAIETISPRMAPIETNSPRKAAIETTNSQTGPIETTSPQTGLIEATSPRMAAIETTSSQTGHIKTTSPQTALIETSCLQIENPNPTSCPNENKPYEIGFKV